MKQFFKYVLATVVGLLAVGLFMGLMGLGLIGAMLATSDTKPSVSEGTVLHIELSGDLHERAADNPFATLLGNSSTFQSQGLKDLLTAIKEAKQNDKVKGIYIECGVLNADFASLQELRQALLDFKKSKKFILAYGDSYLQSAYYVASVADKLIVNPSGMIDWHGIASQPIFFTDLMKKVGVKMQVFKVGTYKSAVEPYILTRMSDANREQVQSFIGDIWQGVCTEVAASRHLTTAQLNSYADSYVYLAAPASYVKMHLADTLAYADGVRDQLRALSGQDKVKFISPDQLAKLYEQPKADKYVAVYYAQGDIVDISASTPFGGKQPQIVGGKVVADLDRLANDDRVAAVVLRINSGGGSAYASEQMWRAVQLLKKKKPVVVSMSGMAASGGYYMACGADYIVAEPSTLTGSIGIFGMIPDASGLLTEKLGLHFDVVKTNKSSDFGLSLGRPFNEAESAAMQAYVDRGYRQFLSRVAAGRHMEVDEVDKIAQGRVWTGRQALKIKLVDQLGTLDDAIAVAARRAKLTSYAVTSSPAMASWVDQLLAATVKRDYMEEKLRATLGEYYAPLTFVASLGNQPALQARVFYLPNIK